MALGARGCPRGGVSPMKQWAGSIRAGAGLVIAAVRLFGG